MKIFHKLAIEQGLNPSETKYFAATRGQKNELQFSKSGDPEIEKRYRTHYISPELKEEKKRKIIEKQNKAPDLVVFIVIKDRQCAECGIEILSDNMLFVEKDKPLCLTCADLGHLIFLSRGDAALTRRATKYSSLRAVVVKFSRARKRYERQGILIEQAALEKAESECEQDEEKRQRLRILSAQRREIEDENYAKELALQLKMKYKKIPDDTALSISIHTSLRGSGRIGRTAAAKNFDDHTIEIAVIAHIRHCHTEYDSLLMQGVDRTEARSMVREAVNAVLDSWR